jgi:hypothetical protein
MLPLMPKLKKPTASFVPGAELVPLRTSEPTATTVRVLVKMKGEAQEELLTASAPVPSG